MSIDDFIFANLVRDNLLPSNGTQSSARWQHQMIEVLPRLYKNCSFFWALTGFLNKEKKDTYRKRELKKPIKSLNTAKQTHKP